MSFSKRRSAAVTLAQTRPSSKNSSASLDVAALDGIIRDVRGEQAIIDADLTRVYGVAPKILNQAVKRNRDKFPSNFPPAA